MKKSNMTRSFRNFTINLGPQHPAGYLTYIFTFSLFLIVCIGWGVIFSDNIHILVLGVGGIGVCFTLIINIKYPHSLKDKREKNYTFFTYFYENKSIIQNLLLVLLVGAFLSLGMPTLLLSQPLQFVVLTPGFLFGFQWMFCICITTVVLFKIPSLS
jgi:hypothetical protein